MACENLGVLIDTSVFVSWWNREREYVRLMEPIEGEQLYVVICNELYVEYLRQMKKRYAGYSEWGLKHDLSEIEKRFRVHWATPISTTLIEINRKDQPHMDCAHNTQHRVHILISDDPHFIQEKENCPIPIILTFNEFMDIEKRRSACGDAKNIVRKIEQYGVSKVFAQRKQ